MTELVFVPVTLELARRLRAGDATGPWLAFTVTSGLRAELSGSGRQPGDDEIEYAALNAAGVAHLVDPAATDPRLVLAADVADASLADLDLAGPGTVTVGELGWRQVTALFADDPEAAEVVAAARSAARGCSLEESSAVPEVAALLDDHDLLWYAPEELDALS